MLKTGLIVILFTALFIPGKVAKINVQQLHSEVLQPNDTLYIVNFWATWCKPCVGEMPYFEESARKFADQKVKVIFVSLNSPKELQLVERFGENKQIQSEIKLLDAGNPNVWIDQVDNSWSGSIPATVMYRGGKKIYFREGEFTQNELDSLIQNKKP